MSSEEQNQFFKELVDKLFFLCVAFIAFQPVPKEFGRSLISKIADKSRFPSDHISLSVPCRSNLAQVDRCFL